MNTTVNTVPYFSKNAEIANERKSSRAKGLVQTPATTHQGQLALGKFNGHGDHFEMSEEAKLQKAEAAVKKSLAKHPFLNVIKTELEDNLKTGNVERTESYRKNKLIGPFTDVYQVGNSLYEVTQHGSSHYIALPDKELAIDFPITSGGLFSASTGDQLKLKDLTTGKVLGGLGLEALHTDQQALAVFTKLFERLASIK